MKTCKTKYDTKKVIFFREKLKMKTRENKFNERKILTAPKE